MQNIEKYAERINKIVFGDSINYEDLEFYLEQQGIDVRYVSNPALDGYLRWDQNEGCPVITVSISNNALVRQRFTMAHELGHLILEHDWIPGANNDAAELKLQNKNVLNTLAYRGKAKYTKEEYAKEREANKFAASFLIPISGLKIMVQEAIDNKQSGDQLINDVARKYKVSTPTARFRVKHYLENFVG
ncbi:ImmA/IrrE family metallo-endopeptidase [Lactobacillus sp. ESL0679]|uniref:ImmA/IrrE family metallo-endopeptidase n=1 Tax=unclassified Lactobacillus TaxID=2620435 RepID=UPI0023F70345|nr:MULTISPECIES: ImmA/IrrE family metallo-endopeptidase [unclassified Lactobacillus]MDF7682307.1 ImmA/IrrE family metallo-endopeptidase [Lactobacillus sp. ESL0679]WEV36865.1 ImmA/IrrE family metallo-endopeptidase [Lactobacillus sp. ESL0677]